MSNTKCGTRNAFNSAGSELDRLGVRNGDAPYAYHGGGWIGFASAMEDYERNRLAEFSGDEC